MIDFAFWSLVWCLFALYFSPGCGCCGDAVCTCCEEGAPVSFSFTLSNVTDSNVTFYTCTGCASALNGSYVIPVEAFESLLLSECEIRNAGGGVALPFGTAASCDGGLTGRHEVIVSGTCETATPGVQVSINCPGLSGGPYTEFMPMTAGTGDNADCSTISNGTPTRTESCCDFTSASLSGIGYNY